MKLCPLQRTFACSCSAAVMSYWWIILLAGLAIGAKAQDVLTVPEIYLPAIERGDYYDYDEDVLNLADMDYSEYVTTEKGEGYRQFCVQLIRSEEDGGM
ncbi:hypothetical protein AGOR_G00202680 [Albula goreensis]|uniref:Uncharacterized protein n=1 Tax=Albula goreensis TaxID=1534307 RepID=A0A8T3CU46_9TELE|nr:hypothetical protein AGOR_G00202680 [Albula goreensis]